MIRNSVRNLVFGSACLGTLIAGCVIALGPSPVSASTFEIIENPVAEPDESVRWVRPTSGIVVDGDVSEWDTDEFVRADSQWVYLRLRSDGQSPPPDRDGVETRISVEALPTGQEPIQTSGRWKSVLLGLKDGQRGMVPGIWTRHCDGGFCGTVFVDRALPEDVLIEPGYPSAWFEMRIRTSALWASSGHDSRIRVLSDDQEVFAATFSVPPDDWANRVLSDARDRLTDGSLTREEYRAVLDSIRAAVGEGVVPTRAPGSVRVMTWSLPGLGDRLPDGDAYVAFFGTLRVVQPDVVLIQDWYHSHGTFKDAAAFEAELNRRGGDPQAEWRVVTDKALRVAVATRLSIVSELDAPASRADDRPARFVGAVVETEHGRMLVGSVATSRDSIRPGEDLATGEERAAAAVNSTLREAIAEHGTLGVILGGPLYVPGRAPTMDRLGSGLDADGGDLRAVPAGVLGDPSGVYTLRPFVMPRERPGYGRRSRLDPTLRRLDYLLAGPRNIAVSQAFVVNTGRLAGESLKHGGLTPESRLPMKHLPVVADVIVCPDGCD